VTVVEKGPRLIGLKDADVSEAVAGILRGEGIALRLNAECIRFGPHDDGIAVGVNCGEGQPKIVGSHRRAAG
jgi:NADPH-dependent 2,4-dienoyl-CoA reductase/sulfur reductase-like enzyme